MLKYMLDTNICIALLRGQAQHLHSKFNSEALAMCISAVAAFELRTGVEKSPNKEKSQNLLNSLLANLEVLDFGEKAAAHAADIRAVLERQGNAIGPCDTLIAGHARSEGLVVVTDNENEFRRVEGLRVENWIRDLQ